MSWAQRQGFKGTATPIQKGGLGFTGSKINNEKGQKQQWAGGSGEEGSLEDYVSFPVNVNISAYFRRRQWHPTPVLLPGKIPWTQGPSGLQSTESRRVIHNRVTSLSLFTFMHWRRKWQSTPMFLPRESQGRRSLVGCCLWGRSESDTTEATYSSLLQP